MLPVLTGRGCEDPGVSGGATAGLRFLEMAFGNVEEKVREEIARALEACCGLDTEGMIEIVERLKSLV